MKAKYYKFANSQISQSYIQFCVALTASPSTWDRHTILKRWQPPITNLSNIKGKGVP